MIERCPPSIPGHAPPGRTLATAGPWTVREAAPPRDAPRPAVAVAAVAAAPSGRGVRVTFDRTSPTVLHALRGDGPPAAFATELAHLAGSAGGLDPVALYEDLAFGFRIGDRCLAAGVRRVRRAAAVDLRDDGTCDIVPCAGAASAPDAPGAVRALASIAADGFRSGAALELSGGVDSRLVLALGLHGGCGPRRAFTIADAASNDVAVARELARIAGAEHRVVDPPAASESIAADAAEFAARSGWTANAAAYAWLPSVFRSVADFRDAQVGGVGGEVGEGFYHTPLDPLFGLAPSVAAWIRLRLEAPGNPARRLYRPEAHAELRRAAARDVEAAFAAAPGNWRAKVDRFYLHERVENWALPGLAACQAWYAVHMPLLSAPYETWAASLDEAGRAGKSAQRALIAELAPQLADVPFSGPVAAAGAPTRSGGALSRRLRRAADRLVGTQRPPPARWADAADRLAADPAIRSAVERLSARTELGLDAAAVRAALAAPRANAAEVGALVTAALGAEALGA